MSIPSRSRPRLFWDIPLGLELLNLSPQPFDLELIRLHLPFAGKRMRRIGSKILHPLPQHVLVNIEVARRLLDCNATLPD